MYEWKATNAIYLDDEVAGKGRQFKCRFLVPGLVKYDFGVCLLTKENADRFIQGFVGCPVIINHQDLTDKNAKEKSVGNIFSVWFDEKDGYYWCNGIITDKHAIELIDKGYSVSCQYTITDYSDNTTGALHNGNSYDKLIEDGKPEHLAIVNNPRYEGAIIAVNAILEEKELQAENSQESFEDQFKDTLYTALAEGIANRLGELIASNEDKWITIHPHGEESEDYRRLKLKDGETPKEAMQRMGWYEKRKAQDEKQKKLVEEKIKELQEKAKKVGGENTVLGKKYLAQIKELQKGNIGVKEETDNTKDNKVKEQPKGNGLLPNYAQDFFDKKEKRDAAYEKWHKILAELEEKAKDDKKFIEYQKQIDDIYAKMHAIKTYNQEYQALINQKNKILDAKHEYSKEFYKEAYAAQEEYSQLSISIDKKDIIKKMSSEVKKQISKISAQNNNLVKQLDKIDTSRFGELKKEDEEIIKQQTELSSRSLKLDWNDPERKEIRAKFEGLAKRRGEIKQEKRELEEKTALEVSKILQVKNGVNLNTHCSSKMQAITDKLKKCLNGVIPETNYNNKQMTVKGHSGRAFHSGSTINISSNDDIGTAIHETMHNLEEQSEHVLMNSLAFAASRTEGEKQKSLKRLTGLSYKSNEVCKKDNFFNPYCGKLYDEFGGRDKTFINARASEIMSMGVQELFTNPKEFAKNDREYFDFVVANLQGKLWN